MERSVILRSGVFFGAAFGLACSTPAPQEIKGNAEDGGDGGEGGDERPEAPPEAPVTVAVQAARPEVAWPPPPLSLMPLVGDPAPGEGQWRPVPAFVQQNAGAPPMMFQATLRNRKLKGPKRDLFDAKRWYEVEVLIWDPEQVELRFMAGVMEPEAPVSRRGAGEVPRTQEVLGRLVAVFNGGWRTKDAKTSGVMTDRQPGLPPGPDLATIALYDGGRVEMGTWEVPSDPPAEMHSFRQNAQPIYGEGRANPLERVAKWGGTGGVGGSDGPYTIRSGICRTKSGHLAYVYGEHMDHLQLAEVMEKAGCDYGVHLDMNGIHAGLEFFALSGFRQGPRGKLAWDVQAGRLTPKIYYKPFPRYLQRHPKDFFYLLRRSTLPTRLASLELKGLPQPGSARNRPAAAAGEAGGVRAIAWDASRAALPAKGGALATEGGLQVIVDPGEAPSGGPVASLSRGVDGGWAVSEGEVDGAALRGARYEGKPAEGEVIRVLGAFGSALVVLEAPIGARAALESAMASLPGAGWMALGAGSRVLVRSPSVEAGRWVEHDGISGRGSLVEGPERVPEGMLGFGLPGERALVGDLFDGPRVGGE